MKLGLRLFVGLWLVGFTFEAINAIGQNIQHPGIFHGHLWDGPIKIGWITALSIAAIPLISMILKLLFTGVLDGSVFENTVSDGMVLLYGFMLAAIVLAPFQILLNSLNPYIKLSVNAVIGLYILSGWAAFTTRRTPIVLWEINSKLATETKSKATVVQEHLSLPL